MLAIDPKVQTLIGRLRAYVEMVLHVTLTVESPVPAGGLPGYIVDRYTLVEARLMERPCLLVFPTGDAADTPEAVARHRDRLASLFPDRLPILVIDTIAAGNRHRLIQRHIPFIVPGTQLFVPQLALDLREHFSSNQAAPGELLTPSAQLLVIAGLNEFDLDSETATSLRQRYGYTPMTMGRAIDELEDHGLIETHKLGKFRVIKQPMSRKALWKKARRLLGSPVQRALQVPVSDIVDHAPLAGESGLAYLTDLSGPRRETRAIGAREWLSLVQQFDYGRTPAWDEPVIDLQIWSYDPRAIENGEAVDPISLWLSIPDLPDERYGQAKAQLLKLAGL
jgi:DNA-binding transcriptional ArsR family regulator